MAHLHLNKLSLICDMWLNKITLKNYLEISTKKTDLLHISIGSKASHDHISH